MAEMPEDQLCRIVDSLVKDARAYRNDRSTDRTRAMEYYDGEMTDTPSDDGRSKVVSRDVRAEVKKVLPSIVRIILGGDKVVEYQPVAGDDEKAASQASDYVNYLAFPESKGPEAVHDGIFDALLLRNGIIKWWQERKVETTVSLHTGLDDAAFALLAADDEVEVLEHTAQQAMIEQQPGMAAPVTLHDVRIRRKIEKSRSRLAAVAPENFLIHPDAIRLDESPILGEHYPIRRSDLVAMGYDRKRVDDLPMAGLDSKEAQDEEDTRRRDLGTKEEIAAKAMQEVDYYDLLVRVDFDNDGIAELRRVVFAGGIGEKYLFENEPWDEINYADIVAERRPHQWEGTSIFDDVGPIQRIKTVLLRQTLDNLYWQNCPQPIVQEAAIVNPEAVTNPAFGLPIRVKGGTDVRAAIGTNVVPFVADKSFAMLEYLDNEKRERTGISDAASGMAQDALQNMTAKASAMMEQAGIGQVEMMVRTIAECLKPVFRGLLKLLIQHQDMPRTVRMRGNWEQYDPRTWNADMDVTVNTGLGAGTRERDMMMMTLVTGVQEKLLASFGPVGNPYVKPDQLYNGIAKMVEASGLKSVDQYFTRPDEQAVAQFEQQMASRKSPEQEKAEGQIAIEKAKGEIQVALEDKRMQVEASKEREQRDADLIVKQAELEKDALKSEHEAQIKAGEAADKIQVEREKIASNERIKLAEIEAKLLIERERMEREDARAAADREARQQEQANKPEMVE